MLFSRGALLVLASTCANGLVLSNQLTRTCIHRVSVQSYAEVGTAGSSPQSPRDLSRAGMTLFRQGRVQESAETFDKVLEIDDARYGPILWQRGLSLYYADRYQEGADQFRRDVKLNPNDTEEAIWAFMCEAHTIGFQAAQSKLLALPPDRRPYMRAAYRLFAGQSSEAELAEVGHAAGAGSAEDFYAQLYLGLYNEAKAAGNGGLCTPAATTPTTATATASSPSDAHSEVAAAQAGCENKARAYMKAAAASPYGSRSGDYMWFLSKVHVAQRGWT